MRRSKWWILLLVSYLKYLLNPKSQDFLFVSFGICGFMLYKEVHFEIKNFVYCVRYGLKFIFSVWIQSLTVIPFIEKTLLVSHWIAFILLLKKSIVHIYGVLFSTSYSISLVHFSLWRPITHCLNHYSIIITLESK